MYSQIISDTQLTLHQDESSIKFIFILLLIVRGKLMFFTNVHVSEKYIFGVTWVEYFTT